MTESEWLETRDHPQWMISELKGTPLTRTKVGRRKLRLFACGCCRLIWPHLTDPRMTRAVEVTERFADGDATSADLEAAAGALEPLTLPAAGSTELDWQACDVAALAQSTADPQPFSAAFSMTTFGHPLAGHRGDEAVANDLLCDLLRDVIGNPFRPVGFDAVWRTSTAVGLAQGMYEAHDFGAMPILADALQDAGCDSADVLTHCRDPQQVHVRGCWVVDLVLGKA